MIAIYARRIWDGAYSFDKVPAKYKNGVIEKMQQDVAAGLHTPEEYKDRTGMDYPVVEDEPEE